MDWKTLLAYITGTVDHELLVRNEYLVAEHRILRHQIVGRVRLTDGECTPLAEVGQKLSKQALKEVARSSHPIRFWADPVSSWPTSVTAPSSAKFLDARRWLRSLRPESYVWRRSIAPGATTAVWVPWPISGTP